jgi:hypothetical protein
VAAALLLLAATGCRRGEPPRHLERLAVADGDGERRLAAFGVTRDDVGRLAGAALDAGPRLRLAPAPEGARRFLARVAVLDAGAVSGPEGAVARVAATIELSPVGEGTSLRETGLGVEPLAGAAAPPDAAVREALAKALHAAARSIALHLEAAAKDDAALVRDLDATDAGVRDHAVRVLAERKNPAAVPGLVERLGDADPDVADRAVGALAEIGDPRAVGPLIELAHRRGPDAMEGYVRIVADLGGPEARAWLETLAAGHPDAAVRAAAEESLAALAARGARRAAATR